MDADAQLRFKRHDCFRRDLKRLLRKYKSLEEDLGTFQKILRLVHAQKAFPPEAQGIFRVAGIDPSIEDVFIAKKLACRSLKGSGVRSGIRVVYRFVRESMTVEYNEIFHKSRKPVEDKSRIEELYSN